MPTEVSEKAKAALESLPVLSLAITKEIMNAPDWQSAKARIDEYLANPSTGTDGLDTFVIEQLEVQTMLYYSDLLGSDATAERTAILKEYLEVLIRNRYPGPETIDEIVGALGLNLPPGDAIAAAQSALDAYEYLKVQLEPVQNACSECYDAVVAGGNDETTATRAEAVARLTEIAGRTE